MGGQVRSIDLADLARQLVEGNATAQGVWDDAKQAFTSVQLCFSYPKGAKIETECHAIGGWLAQAYEQGIITTPVK